MKILDENNQHKIDGRTRLQKLVFLAQKEASSELPSEYTFIPYDYGPFSANLLHEIEDLDEKGYVQENKVPGVNGMKYQYKLTEEGAEYVDEHFEELDDSDAEAISETADFIEGMYSDTPISRLLEHVYNNYPKYAEESVLN